MPEIGKAGDTRATVLSSGLFCRSTAVRGLHLVARLVTPLFRTSMLGVCFSATSSTGLLPAFHPADTYRSKPQTKASKP